MKCVVPFFVRLFSLVFAVFLLLFSARAPSDRWYSVGGRVFTVADWGFTGGIFGVSKSFQMSGTNEKHYSAIRCQGKQRRRRSCLIAHSLRVNDDLVKAANIGAQCVENTGARSHNRGAVVVAAAHSNPPHLAHPWL